jgi:hypothetical protein
MFFALHDGTPIQMNRPIAAYQGRAFLNDMILMHRELTILQFASHNARAIQQGHGTELSLSGFH